MPTNETNISSDWSIDLIDPIHGGVQSFSLITGFSKRQDVTEVSSTGLDGVRRRANIPDGWSGSITFDRASRALDDYFAQVEDDYYAGRVTPPCSITETIREVDLSLSQWRYTKVNFSYSDGGNAQGKEKVAQTVDWTAARRIRVF